MNFFNLFSWGGKTPSTEAPPPSYESSQRDSTTGGWVRFVFLEDIEAPDYRLITDVPEILHDGRELWYVWGHRVSRDVPWHGELRIWAHDVKALLNGGLFWSTENVDLIGGEITLNGSRFFESKVAAAAGYQHSRIHKIADASPHPQWHGWLSVYSHDPETLFDLHPDQLSASNIRFATAWDAQKNLLYHYDSAGVEPNVNKIFGNRPMKGWWPWPKDRKDVS